MLLGPHMHLVGKRLDRQRKERRERKQAYIEADRAGKQRMLDEYRDELMKDARARVEAAKEKEAKRSAREHARIAFLQQQPHLFLNPNNLQKAQIKYGAVADPLRSTARPLAAAAADSPCLGGETTRPAAQPVESGDVGEPRRPHTPPRTREIRFEPSRRLSLLQSEFRTELL